MASRSRLLGLGAAIGALGYGPAIRAARARVASDKSALVPTRHGILEYAEAGAGPPVLMIHGTGGGFDQGLLLGRDLVKAGYRVIAPSRFGYLRSEMPERPTAEKQADAFADLLDALGIERIAVIGGSAGARSAVQFALRHKERCAALVPLVPATYSPNHPRHRPWAPWQWSVLRAVMYSDLLCWVALSVTPDRVIGTILATDPHLVKTVSPEERARLHKSLWTILPITLRRTGMLADSDHDLYLEPVDFSAIAAPTLAIAAEDDRFGAAEAARHLAATVPGARSIVYRQGGHLCVGHNADRFAAIRAFLAENGYGTENVRLRPAGAPHHAGAGRGRENALQMPPPASPD